jgi:hypothetical protein
MSDTAANVKAIRTLLAEIPNRTSSDISYAEIIPCALPLVQSDPYVVLCFLERTLEAECHKSNPRSLESRAAEIVRGAKPHGYWSKGPISEGLLDPAMQSGILNADEKALLIRLEDYINFPPEHVTASVICELEKGGPY